MSCLCTGHGDYLIIILFLLFILLALLLETYDKQAPNRALIMCLDGHVVLGPHTWQSLHEVLDKSSRASSVSAIAGPEGICTASFLQSCGVFVLYSLQAQDSPQAPSTLLLTQRSLQQQITERRSQTSLGENQQDVGAVT